MVDDSNLLTMCVRADVIMCAVGEPFLVKVGKYLTTRMHSCSSSCIICDAPLGFEGVKPAVCPKPLCMHRCVLCAVRVR